MTRSFWKPAAHAARGAADRDAEADVLDRADRGSQRAASSSARRWKETSTISSSSRRRTRCTVSPRGRFSSTIKPDAAAAHLDRLGERRVHAAAARRVVRHLEPVPDVELDEVGADLDRPLERRQRVLRQLGRSAAVRDHEHSRTPARDVDPVDELVRRRHARRAERARQPDDVRPGGFRRRDADVRVLEDEQLRGREAEALRGEEVRLRVGLAACHVVLAERPAEKSVAEARRREHGLDLVAERRRHDRDGHPLRGPANRGAHVRRRPSSRRRRARCSGGHVRGSARRSRLPSQRMNISSSVWPARCS